MTEQLMKFASDVLNAGLALLVAVVFFLFLTWLRRRVTNPALQAIIDALLPLAQQAVYGAETLALKMLQSGQSALEGADKKKIADAFYAALPETLMIGGRPVPIGRIKTIISKEKWAELVQRAYEEADARVLRNQAWLEKQVGDLLAADAKLVG